MSTTTTSSKDVKADLIKALYNPQSQVEAILKNRKEQPKKSDSKTTTKVEPKKVVKKVETKKTEQPKTGFFWDFKKSTKKSPLGIVNVQACVDCGNTERFNLSIDNKNKALEVFCLVCEEKRGATEE